MKSDKELAVEVVCAYISVWFQKSGVKPLDGATIHALITESYNAIHSLPESSGT